MLLNGFSLFGKNVCSKYAIFYKHAHTLYLFFPRLIIGESLHVSLMPAAVPVFFFLSCNAFEILTRGMDKTTRGSASFLPLSTPFFAK
jgi:hypothetical protein